MKKIFALLLAASLLFSCPGCSTGSNTDSVPPDQISSEHTEETETEKLVQASVPQFVVCPSPDSYFTDSGFDQKAYNDDYEQWNNSLYRGTVPGKDAMFGFFEKAGLRILADPSENTVFSPANIWFALAMLTELTDGITRQQLFDCLEFTDTENLRETAEEFYASCSKNDGCVTVIPSAAVWLRSDIDVRPDTLSVLADSYHASAFRGIMGSASMDEQLRSWLDENTNGLLEKEASGVNLPDDTVIALTASLYYHAAWTEKFAKNATADSIFHSPVGDVTCRFMNRTGSDTLYCSPHFYAVCLPVQNDGWMWIILPDEDSSLQEIITDGSAMQLLKAGISWENSRRCLISMSIPKFDISSGMNLKDCISDLGVTDVFDPQKSDFTPLAEDTGGLAVTRIQHNARVMIDEDGCEAAAFTVIPVEEACALDEGELFTFTADRPFLFAVTNAEGLPLFMGTVCNPE